MGPKHRKRFNCPIPFPEEETKSGLKAMLANLQKLSERKPFEKSLEELLSASGGWLDVFKTPGSPTAYRTTRRRASRRTDGAKPKIDEQAIQSFLEAGQLGKARRAARRFLRGIDVKKTVAEEARSEQESGPATFALRSLAMIANIQGDSEVAERAYRLLVKIYSANAGNDVESTLQYKYSLAEFYADEEPEKAVDLLEQVIDSCELLGTTSSPICAGAKSLAGALQMYDSETLDEAAGYLADAEDLQTQAYATDPESWWRLAVTVMRLAQFAMHRGEHEEARTRYERSLSLYRKHADSESGQATLEFASLLMEYGQCLLELGENRNAFRAGKEAVDLVSREFGPLSVEVIPFLMDLGNVYRDTLIPENAKRACRLFRKVIVLHEQHFRDVEDYLAEASNLLDAHKGIIAAYTTMQSYDKAEMWAKRAIRVIHDLDEGSLELQQIYKMLEFICESDGRRDEARQYEALAREAFESAAEVEDDDEEENENEDEENDGQGEGDEGDWWRGEAQSDHEDD